MENLGLEVKADPKELAMLDKIGDALVVIYNCIQTIRTDNPPISVSNIPPVYVKNFRDLKPYFELVEKATKHLAVAITLIASKDSPKENITDMLKDIKDNTQKTNELLKELIKK